MKSKAVAGESEEIDLQTVYVPQKILVRLTSYVQSKNIGSDERIFPISYVAAWSMVKKAGMLVNIELRPHDLRRHAATYASRSGTPIEIVIKVILRHAGLSTTQRYLGKVNDTEAIRWIETLYGVDVSQWARQIPRLLKATVGISTLNDQTDS